MKVRQLQRRYKGLSRNQRGFVSFFVTLIVMAILTLVVIGFTNLIRQEQRRNLDRQLNTQAFYAAESGINDAINGLKAGKLTNRTNCDPSTSPVFNPTISAAEKVGYTCVLINTTPPDLKFDSVPVVGQDQPINIALKSGGPFFDKMDVSWDSANTPPDPIPNNTNADFPTAKKWGAKVGMVRIDLVNTSALDRTSLVNNTYTFFLDPSSSTGVGSINLAAATKGDVFLVRCNNGGTYRCQVTLNLPAAPQSSTFLMRLQSVYNPVALQIDNVKDTTGTTIKLVGGQAVIDATGRANDVFRRIQVRVPIDDYANFQYPIFSIESGDHICKLYSYDGTKVVPNCPPDIPPPPVVIPDPTCTVNCGGDPDPAIGPTGCQNPDPTKCVQKPITWTRSYLNHTNTNGLAISGCTWTVSVIKGNPALANQVTDNGFPGCDTAPSTATTCQPAYCRKFTFPTTAITVCTIYQIQLTVRYAGGTKTTTYNAKEPGGSASPC